MGRYKSFESKSSVMIGVKISGNNAVPLVRAHWNDVTDENSIRCTLQVCAGFISQSLLFIRWLAWSVGQSVSRSDDWSVSGWLVCRSVGRGRSVCRLASHVVGLLTDQLDSQSIGRSIGRLVGQLDSRSVDRLVFWSVGLSVIRSVGRSVGWLVGRSVGRVQ